MKLFVAGLTIGIALGIFFGFGWYALFVVRQFMFALLFVGIGVAILFSRVSR